MNGIWKIMRFNLNSALPVIRSQVLVITFVLAILSLLISPFIITYIIFVFQFYFISPLHQHDKKNSRNALYGLLPVDRKAITRGRFLHEFVVLFVGEILAVSFVFISINLYLQRFLPNQELDFVQTIVETAQDKFNLAAPVIVFVLCMFGTLFTTTVGQIFGHSNMMRAMAIGGGSLFVLFFIFLMLSMNDVIPMIEFHGDKISPEKAAALCVSAQIVMFFLTVICGEITANIVSKREL